MGAHTKYGECKRCEMWYPRDDLTNMNVKVFTGQGRSKWIRLRLCPGCLNEELEYLHSIEWKRSILRTESEVIEMGLSAPNLSKRGHDGRVSVSGQ